VLAGGRKGERRRNSLVSSNRTVLLVFSLCRQNAQTSVYEFA